MGYYFYFPPENKIVVARYAEFFKKNLITQEVSRRAIDLEEIQHKDTSLSKITSKIHMEVKRTHRAINRLCLNVEVEEHSLEDLNEPTSYKSAMMDPESKKLLNAMNAEMQSMIENMVWVLVDLPPNCKTVRSKWIFKKKTDMDGSVHTYKARLVAKGYIQHYEVDYEETFSHVANIRTIRILISIAAFYDYEIWKMDVKTAFLNGYLDKDIYMIQPKGFVDPKHPKKCFAMKDLGEAAFIKGIKIYRDRSKRLIGLSQSSYMDKILKRYKMDNSKRGHIPVQERLDLNKTQAEYIAASEAAMEAVWIRKFILRLGIVPTINKLIKIFCDNSSALLIANEPGVPYGELVFISRRELYHQKGARHYQRRYHYVRECVELGEIRILKVHTDNNLADPFTKALSNRKLTQHARGMGLRPASSFM
ncbi:retrotransposon protein, putative, ty1-copia subclass [Tanacetum coccineum]